MKHAIIIGAGFGGLAAARHLANIPDLLVTIVDRHNHHLFQPLLYQVAIGGLEGPQIAEPVRAIISEHRNQRFRLGEVEHVDLDQQIVTIDQRRLRYDYLIVAAGSRTTVLGVPGAAEKAHHMKQLTQAMSIRDHVLSACEAAARSHDPEVRRQLLTFVIVGGGPTGIELAGAIAELRRHVIPHDYPELDPNDFRVIVVESSAYPLASLPESLQHYAAKSLTNDLGVELRSNTRVAEVLDNGVRTNDDAFIPAYTVIWTAGVEGQSIDGLPEASRGGRIETATDISLADHPDVFIVGDLNGLSDPRTGEPYIQVAQLAIQQGTLAAQNIVADLTNRPRRTFKYRDKGTLVTLGRAKAVADVYGFKFRGLFAWFTWLTVHLVQLVGFRNRIFVLFSWIYSYVTFDFSVRIMYRRRKFPLLSTDSEDSAT